MFEMASLIIPLCKCLGIENTAEMRTLYENIEEIMIGGCLPCPYIFFTQRWKPYFWRTRFRIV
jgi:hypothetical protein